MSRDELKKALYMIENYIVKLESKTYPLSRNYDWIESAISVIARIIQEISAEEEVSGNAPETE